jgi:hypothetical protein
MPVSPPNELPASPEALPPLPDEVPAPAGVPPALPAPPDPAVAPEELPDPAELRPAPELDALSPPLQAAAVTCTTSARAASRVNVFKVFMGISGTRVGFDHPDYEAR